MGPRLLHPGPTPIPGVANDPFTAASAADIDRSMDCTFFTLSIRIQGSAMTATKTATPDKAKPAAKDAITLLKADHEAVSQLFAEYERTRSVVNKKALVAELCTALTVHAQLEEELFYPAVKAALNDKQLVPEATVEHTGVKDLIAQLEGVEPSGEMYDAKVKVLSEYVKHHVKVEQSEMFTKAKASSLDLMELGARMAARKDELMAKAARAEREAS
jgi:hemerythrin superfamily protein